MFGGYYEPIKRFFWVQGGFPVPRKSDLGMAI
jgi:hypothetical protein